MPWVIETISRQHELSQFDCGEVSLNQFLKRFALSNDAAGIGRTFVAISPSGHVVRGYYTISTGTVAFENVPEWTGRKAPHYPMPTIHVGRLAVDGSCKGQGLGGLLLANALMRAGRASLEIGVCEVDVIALNDSAREFYLKFGFTALTHNRLHLYLPIEAAKKVAGIASPH